MKKRIQYLIAFMLVAPLLLSANPIKKWDHEKSKTIKKEFEVNADALLRIDNKFGNLDVVSWDQNRIEIEVKITVSGNNESKVIERLSQIDVKFESSRSEVSARTSMEKSSSGWFKSNNKMNYQIDYKVKMPVTNQANFSNDYGSITLNELKGQARISCDYGKINIGSLYHDNNQINMDYGSNSVIGLMNGGDINSDYSKLTIEKAKNINLSADYTDTTFENIENLEFSCDYGKIVVENGNRVSGSGDYLTMKFGKLNKSLEVSSDYGGIKVDKLMKGFESVKVKSDYTGIKIGMEPGSSFDFVANLEHGSFDYDSDGITYEKKVVKNSAKYYEGYVGTKGSGSRIDVSSEYGSVKLYNN